MTVTSGNACFCLLTFSVITFSSFFQNSHYFSGGRMEIKSKSLLSRRLVEYSESKRCRRRDLYDLTLWKLRRIHTACAAITYKLQPQRPSSWGKPIFWTNSQCGNLKILREIKFCKSKGLKNCHFDHFSSSEFSDFWIFNTFKCVIFSKDKIQGLQNGHNCRFWAVKITKFDFT